MEISRPNKCTLTALSADITGQVLAALLVIMLAVLMTVPGVANGAQSGADSGYVIRLASSSGRDFSADDIRGAETRADQAFYATRFNRDGKQWRQLRLGFFNTRAEAESALRQLARHYPGAQITRATSADIRYASSEPVSRPAAVTRQPVSKAAIAETSAENISTTTNKPSFLGGLSKLSPTSWFKRDKKEDASEARQAVTPTNQIIRTESTNNAPVKTVDEVPRSAQKISKTDMHESGDAVTSPAAAVGGDEKRLLSVLGKLSPAKWFSGNERSRVGFQ